MAIKYLFQSLYTQGTNNRDQLEPHDNSNVQFTLKSLTYSKIFIIKAWWFKFTYSILRVRIIVEGLCWILVVLCRTLDDVRSSTYAIYIVFHKYKLPILIIFLLDLIKMNCLIFIYCIYFEKIKKRTIIQITKLMK